MKLMIFIACLLAFAYANEEAEVIKQESEVNPDSFHYYLELSNHIKAEQHGELKEKDNWLVHGDYEYVTKEGKHIKVSYHADENGYHPKIESLN